MLKSKTSRWLAGPYLLWMAIFTVVPLVIVVWYATDERRRAVHP